MATLLPHFRDRVPEYHMDAAGGVLDDAAIPDYHHAKFPAYLGIVTIPAEDFPPAVPNPPTSVVAGAPGTWVPVDADVPADLAEMNALGALGQTTLWTVGQHMVLGDASQCYWNGTTWIAGVAPA